MESHELMMSYSIDVLKQRHANISMDPSYEVWAQERLCAVFQKLISIPVRETTVEGGRSWFQMICVVLH